MAWTQRLPTFRFSSALFLALTATAQVIPDQYIVEMEQAPTAKAPLPRQAQVQRDTVRRAVEDRGGEVLATYGTVLNGIAVEAPGVTPEALAAMPGVRKVYPVYLMYRVLDVAATVVRARDAWLGAGGIERSGAGMKIAIIDSGIDKDHPGMVDDSLTPPPGFPKGTLDSDFAGVSRKIIVARSYSATTPADYGGHGTGVAMAAAGRLHTSPIGDLAGMAPKAFLGNYKVFPDSPNAGASVVNIIHAIEDAVNDGMDVINLSLGSIPAAQPSNDAMVRAVDQAVQRGVVVVVAAGNDGPDLGTLSTLAAGSSSAITVGASVNPRPQDGVITVNGESFTGQTPSLAPDRPFTAPMREVGLACDSLGGGALVGRIALILRGDCTFEIKLNNAQRAGAVAAVIYSDDRPVANWTPGAAKLPAILIANADGLRLKTIIGDVGDAVGGLEFTPGDPNKLARFSARGPSVVDLLKPDLAAPGTSFYTAAQRQDPRGELYSPDGYTSTSGTSFSSPLVAGAAALIKSTNPRLTPLQIRSLLIDTAAAIPATQQESGAGLLNLDAAVRARATAVPASIHFGTGGDSISVGRDVTVTNLAAGLDSFTVTFEPFGDAPVPQSTVASFALEAGASHTLTLRWNPAGLAPGEYRGWVVVRGSSSDVDLRVPYWYGVRDSKPKYVSVLDPSTATTRAGGNITVYVRVADSSGSSLPDFEPVVTVERGSGAVRGIRSVDITYPGIWRVDLRLGIEAGTNSFRVKAGEVSQVHSVVGN